MHNLFTIGLVATGTLSQSLLRSAVPGGIILPFQSKEAVMITFVANLLDAQSNCIHPLKNSIEASETDSICAEISITNKSRTLLTQGVMRIIIPAPLNFLSEQDVQSSVTYPLPAHSRVQVITINMPALKSGSTYTTPYFAFILDKSVAPGTVAISQVFGLFKDIRGTVISKQAELTIKVIPAG